MSLKFIACALALTSLGLSASAAWAGTATRAWVSGKGTDAAGCGAPTTPCRSLQYAHDNIVAAGGEIDILDPAGYGALAITKSISIVNDGVGTAGVQQTLSGEDAITVNAAISDTVTLRGLNIDGLGLAKDGIGVSGGGSLTIDNCVIRHFVHDGVHVAPNITLALSVLNTIASDNGNDGFNIAPTSTAYATGFIDHSAALNNQGNGVSVSGAFGSGPLAFINVTNTNTSNNAGYGVYSNTTAARFGNTEVDLFNDTSNYNHDGYYADGYSAMLIARSEAMWNQVTIITINTNAVGWTTGDNDGGRRGGITGTLSNLGQF